MRALLEHQEQRQDLDRFAQAHVVGKARAKPQLRQQMQPLHARALIRAQSAAQCFARIGTHPAIRLAHRFESSGEPWPGRNLAPAPTGVFAAVLRLARAREQPHSLAEAQALGFGAGLHRLELRQRLLQPLAVDLHPFAAHQRQAIGALQDLADLLFAKRFVIERHLKLEIQERGSPNEGRLRTANRCLDLGTRRAV